MASLRETIEDIIAPKLNPNGDGSHVKTNSLMQYFVNHFELNQIRIALIADGGTFTEEFFNIDDNRYLVWDNTKKYFVDKVTGEENFISLFYDRFDDLVQSALDWTFANNAGVNNWVFGTDNLPLDNTNAMYVSNNGTDNNYSSGGGNAGSSHASVDVEIPVGNEVRIKVNASSNGVALADDLKIFAYSVVTVPVADVAQPGANEELLIAEILFHDDFTFDLPASFTGTTMTLSFQWRNNTLGTRNNAANIGSIEVLYK